MHQVTLMGQCAADDAACSRRHPVAPLAVGATFHPEVEAELAGTTTPNLALESADVAVLGVDATGALVAKQPGASAVLISTDDGSVVDFVHVWVAPVTSIALARRDGDRIVGSVGLAVGEDLTIAPALWNGSQRLAGDADVAWQISANSSVTLLRDGSADRRRLRARAPGKATLTVAMGGAKASLDVEVVP
jgi:hypothetical protein